MKRIIIPISFSVKSTYALIQAKVLADHYQARITLLHCYSPVEHNRRFDFPNKEYKKEVEKLLLSFYKENISGEVSTVQCLAVEGSISGTMHNISSKFDLIVLTKNDKANSAKTSPISEKLLRIMTKAHCPVLICPVQDTPLRITEIQSAWHIKRKDSETEIIDRLTSKLGIARQCVNVKSLDQQVFISPLWKRILKAKTPINSAAPPILVPMSDQDEIDLLMIVYYNQSLFEKFIGDSRIKSIYSLQVPILLINQSQARV